MSRFTLPPRALSGAKLDNLVLVPASLLPRRGEYQALANSLPRGSTLIVLPARPGAAKTVLERVSRQISLKGSQVATICQGDDRCQLAMPTPTGA
jgi:hypothetical protein